VLSGLIKEGLFHLLVRWRRARDQAFVDQMVDYILLAKSCSCSLSNNYNFVDQMVDYIRLATLLLLIEDYYHDSYLARRMLREL